MWTGNGEEDVSLPTQSRPSLCTGGLAPLEGHTLPDGAIRLAGLALGLH